MADDLVTAPLSQAQPLQPQVSTLDKLFYAIYGQESSFGANPATSLTGARGPMQIEPGTFAQFAQPGENIDNATDNIRVGRRILAHYLQAYNGDAARAAVAYFSGPGNVAPPDSPTPWIHNSSDGGTTVAQYVGSIGHRMGDPNIAQFARLGGVGGPSLTGSSLLSQQQPLSPLEALADAGTEQAKAQGAPASGGAAPAVAAPVLKAPPLRPVQLPVQQPQPAKMASPLDYYHALLTKQPILGGGNA